MKLPPRSLPPGGADPSLGTALRDEMHQPLRSHRPQPREGADRSPGVPVRN
jgi:hypothetical protein